MSPPTTKKRSTAQWYVYDFLKRRLNPPHIFTLFLGIVLWVAGVLLFFLLPQAPLYAIWPLIISTALLLLGAVLEQL